MQAWPNMHIIIRMGVTGLADQAAVGPMMWQTSSDADSIGHGGHVPPLLQMAENGCTVSLYAADSAQLTSFKHKTVKACPPEQ